MKRQNLDLNLEEFVDSPYWLPLKRFIAKEINSYRQKYENLKIDEKHALVYVAKIQALKDFVKKIDGTKDISQPLIDEYK